MSGQIPAESVGRFGSARNSGARGIVRNYIVTATLKGWKITTTWQTGLTKREALATARALNRLYGK
jgi:hypothetical protein